MKSFVFLLSLFVSASIVLLPLNGDAFTLRNADLSLQKINLEVEYPSDAKIQNLKSLLELAEEGSSQYTSLEEKAIKYIVLDTFESYSELYRKIFRVNDNAEITDIYNKIPQSYYSFPLKNNTTTESLVPFVGAITRSSMNYNYSLNSDKKDSFLRAIERKIEGEQNFKTWRDEEKEYRFIEPEELYEMEIFHNGKRVKIGDYKDEIIYTPSQNKKRYILKYKNPYFTYDEAMEKISENAKNGNSEPLKKKDYKKLLGDKKVPEIPEILTKIPNDAAFLYVKNPKNLIKILETKVTRTGEMFGYEPGQFIKDMIKEYFGLENIADFSQNMKHGFVILINTVDITRPDFSIILSEKDASFVNMIKFSESLKNKVINTKDGFVYITNSQKQYEAIIKNENIFLPQADDFRFVWEKKADKIQDIFMYVGDAFFENMLEFDSFIFLSRKLEITNQLEYLQQLAFAYKIAFGKNATNISELLFPFETVGDSFLETLRDDFEIKNGIVSHKQLGTIRNLAYLSNIDFDISQISRAELDSYKTSVLGYKDVWRAYLDPLGIILNSTDTGMEIDFYMTPIPNISDIDFLKGLQNVGKKQIEFISNKKIRIGNMSLVFAFDSGKFKKMLESSGENFVAYGLQAMSEVLDGYDIFDYIDGEFALSVGDLSPDIFDGYNLEKLDASMAIKFKNNKKAKDFLKKLVQFVSKENVPSGIGDKITNLLAKPLIKEYKGHKIYYIEEIIGSNGIYYGIFDSFLFIAVNDTAIKKVIDFYKSPELQKQKFATVMKEGKNSLITFLFDGTKVSNNLRILARGKVVGDDNVILPIFEGLLKAQMEMIKKRLQVLKNQQKLQKLYGEIPARIDFVQNGLHFFEKSDAIFVKPVNPNLKYLSQKEILSKVFITQTIDNFNETTNSNEYKTFMQEGLEFVDANIDLITIPLFDTNLRFIYEDFDLFKSFVFSLGMGDDEIFYAMDFFGATESEYREAQQAKKNNTLMLFALLGIVLLVGFGGGAWYFVSKK